ncbi:MAG: hypothetical protein V1674_00540 [Candidatus Omnitrophota bacterium]
MDARIDARLGNSSYVLSSFDILRLHSRYRPEPVEGRYQHPCLTGRQGRPKTSIDTLVVEYIEL